MKLSEERRHHKFFSELMLRIYFYDSKINQDDHRRINKEVL
jgi:hypothetical protein